MDAPDTTFSAAVRMGFVIDVAGYSTRPARGKVDLQHRVSALAGEVLRDLGVALADTHHHGTGDGMVVFLPSEIDVDRALTRLIRSTADLLAEDNRRYRDRMRLRMAVVIGPLGPAAIGFSGDTVVAAGRMVDSLVLRDALADHPTADLAVLVSDQLHGYVVRERHAGLRADEFRPVEVRHKEYQAAAWLWTGPGAPPDRAPGGPVRYRLASPGAPACVLGIRTGRIERVHDVDVWVNSENTDMEMPRFNDFSISSIIRYHGAHRDAGGRVVVDLIADELARVVGDQRPVLPAAAFVTGAGALTASNGVRYVIHVAAVQGEPGAGFQQVRRVGACVANALALADRLAAAGEPVRSVLVPMLGTGVGGASIPATATELVDATVDYLTATPGSRLGAVCCLAYREVERAELERALGTHPALRAEPDAAEPSG